MTSKEGRNLWLTKPAEKRPLLKSVGRRTAPAGTPEVEEVELQELPAAIERLAARCGAQKRNRPEKCRARSAGVRSRKAPRPGGDRLAQPIRRMNLAGVPVTVG